MSAARPPVPPTREPLTSSYTEEPRWHAMSVDEVVDALQVDPTSGLSAGEANARLAAHGANRLIEPPPRALWRVFLDQFRSLLILILLVAVVLAGAIGDFKDAAVILAVVLFNAALGFYQEHRAERSLAALKQMLALKAEVRRAGRSMTLPAERLVPGDIVLLDAGDKVPADGRLLDLRGLEIDESTLTGESEPVAKSAEPVSGEGLPLSERTNMLYMNTTVTRGRAAMVVTATGMQTEMGRLAGMLATAGDQPTPLQLQLEELGKRLAGIAGGVVALFVVGGVLRADPLVEVVLTAIALAVAAIPEGLPVVVTVTLALGLHRMARQRAVVKRLAAVETLGCTTVVCSDKTGTMTVNQMTARALFYQGQRFTVTGEGYRPEGEIRPDDTAAAPLRYEPLLVPLALCNNSQVRAAAVIGDPTEAALLVLAAKGGIERAAASKLPRIAEIPFDAAHKFMATFHHDGTQVRVFVKGAPDVVLERCATVLDGAGAAPVDERMRAALVREIELMAGRGLRVLTVASRTLAAADFDPAGELSQHVRELTLAGMVGLMDPPRPEVRQAIAFCQQAGVAVKMITGDHKITAGAIARELGLRGDALSGDELERMEEHELRTCIDDIAVFARVAPEQKVRIVRALKARGHVVAMTGDGVNDAPALKSADIGVAMGVAGTDVAREAATMVLTDDNFATIVRAVREGRTIYDNIVKFVRFQLSTNVGAILAVFAAPLLGLPVPFNPLQILWVNIIMDGPPAMALGVEPPRPGSMEEPPRSAQVRILTLRRLGRLAAYGTTMAVGTLAVLYYGLQTGETERALTLAFTTFVLFQVFNVFNARAEVSSTFTQNFFANGKLWLALASVVGLQSAVVHWPSVQAIFGTTALSASDWALAFAVAASVLVLDELRKLAGNLWRALRAGAAGSPSGERKG